MKDNKLGTLVRDITPVPPSKSRTKRLIKEYLLDYISKEDVERIINLLEEPEDKTKQLKLFIKLLNKLLSKEDKE